MPPRKTYTRNDDQLLSDNDSKESSDIHLDPAEMLFGELGDDYDLKTYTKLEEESPVIKKGKKDLKIKKNEVEIYEEELKDFVKKIDVSQDSVNELNKALDKLYDNQINQKKEGLYEFQH